MATDQNIPTIGFLWQPEEITSSVVESARRTRTRAIFDLSSTGLKSAGMALLQADADGDVADLKISTGALMDASLEEFLEDTGIRRIWVEIHPLLLEGAPERYMDRMQELSSRFTVFPILADPNLITEFLGKYSAVKNIALKGCEAAGFVGGETIFTLYATVRSMVDDRAEKPNLHIWGGLATPEAAAAFLSSGARGIVFESLHRLTDLAALSDLQRKKLSKLRPEHTDLVGLNVQAPCRLFNKGNSRAVRELREFAGSLCGAEVTEEQRRLFAGKIESKAIHPSAAGFDRDELIPVGVEAAFAQSFADRFGAGTEDAVNRFVEEIETLCSSAGEKVKAFVQSPEAEALGTRYPFVQGAMSWISDIPEFAFRVAEAGGLPTIALGLMDRATMERKLGSLRDVMADRPFAVNVITLAENPHRDAQLAWIRGNKPRFTVIAAGEPSHARELLESGIEVIYIAPNEELLKLAFEAGVRYVICEGNEAGGHVGEHSTLTLAQIVLDQKRRNPELFRDRKIILAGGICNRETAFMAAVLGADAIQMGTSYLTTREIVETGALTELYQEMILESSPGGTVITGEETGLRIRSLSTPRMDDVCALEREFAAGSEDETVFRQKIEALTAGSLLVAARGLAEPEGKPLDEQTCRERGQFMSGACAGTLGRVRTVDEFHAELAEGSLSEGLPFPGPVREAARPRVEGVDPVAAAASHGGTVGAGRVIQGPGKERIAITGMSIVNSLGNSPEEIWAASVAGKSGIIAVPTSKWDHDKYFHPRPRTPEKTYCKVGAFQHIEVSRKEVGIPPQDFRTMTDATRITMWLARQAIEESGIVESDVPRERIGVLISQNSGEAARTLEEMIVRGEAPSIVSSIQTVLDLTPEMEKAVEDAVKGDRMAVDDTTLLGRLNCAAGGFICNKYGFMGPSWSVSAACATALVALYSAYQMIRNGIIDAAIIGGAEEILTPMHFMEFSALGALSGLAGVERAADEYSRPFDVDRDGMVLGEGGGMIVIERESVARRRGAKVHAYITSMGASNNHLGMVESSAVTQEIAIRASFDDASYGPDEVNLIECHATSTMQGDVEEVHALERIFNADSPTVLTSFKSQIGHTLGASGVNSLIRGVMAMKAGILPATLNFHRPDPEVNLDDAGFSVLRELADWKLGNGKPGRFQVNAFGFGGSNYVVQVEQAMEEDARVLVHPGDINDPAARDTVRQSQVGGVHFFRTEIGGRPYRVGAVADTETEAKKLVESLEPITGDTPIPTKSLRAMARQGLHLGPADEAPEPVAFVFAGQGSHYQGMGHELYKTFPVIREQMDRAAEVADFDLLQLLFYNREEDLQKTRWQQPALFTMEYAIVKYLVSLGVQPAALAGHSLGELTALCLAGVYSFDDGFRVVNKRAQCMDKACEINVDPGVMMAVDAPLDFLEERISGTDQIHITNINSPHQVVLGGDTEAVRALGAELKEQGFRRTLLPVSMAFHSPIMACIHDELEEFVSTIEFHGPKTPVISNTTMKPFPSDPDEIRRIVMAHLESPVHWMENARTLRNDYGVRLFVEVGPRDILSNMIGDTLDDVTCIQTCSQSSEGQVYRNAVAQLYAKGNLPAPAEPRFVTFPGQRRTSPPASLPAATYSPTTASTPSGADAVQRIIQRQINSFVLESFGRFLIPTVLAAIRKEHDPTFTEEDLNRFMGQMLPRVDVAALPTPEPGPVSAQPTPSAQAAPAQAEKAPAEYDTSDVTETVIRIIMEATGYDRDEIDADMDLREDLSIRSSRLPVIMDALEGHFKIKIELEDFMDVRTIIDISEKITEVVARDSGEMPSSAFRATAESPAPEEVDETAAAEAKESLKRLVFSEVPLETDQSQPIELGEGESVALVSVRPGRGLTGELEELFREDYGVAPVPLVFVEDALDTGESIFDARAREGASRAASELGSIDSSAGIVFIIDEKDDEDLWDTREVSGILTGFFEMTKTFLDSPAKKFAVLVHRCRRPQGPGRILAEGILGMFLSLTHEFSSVQFRAVRLEDDGDLGAAIHGALDRGCKVVETIYRNGKAFAREGRVVPTVFSDDGSFELGAGDVVVLSGGASGITSHLARSLAPFGCKIVFLGRTRIDPDIDFKALQAAEPSSEEALARAVEAVRPGISGKELEREISKVSKAVEIVRNVDEMRALGIDTTYYSCDVTDEAQTKEVMEEIFTRFGRIDGIIHGAGILRDNFIKQMSPDDFSVVADVKFVGAINLYEAARKRGLKFFACLSSGASIQGNPGQSNYAAANRIMSSLMSHLREKGDSPIFKALMLPPIEGTGMAEDPEVRAMLKRVNAAYVHVDELAGLFCRELSLGPAQDVWVMFMRSLPDVASSLLDSSEPPPDPGEILVATVSIKKEDFPMIDSVSRVDVTRGELEATRVFSLEKDLWIEDHKPFKALRHPLVSAIMAVETFMEAARMLCPHLRPRGIRDTQFLERIDCPPGLDRSSLIHCHGVEISNRDVRCHVSLATREISPSGQAMERMYKNFEATVILDGGQESEIEELSGFPVRLEELDTRPMDHAEVLEKYSERSELRGRYRVLEKLDGSAPDGVRGRVVYHESEDFASPLRANYQYSPYLFEALMHTAIFYLSMRDENDERAFIPFRLGEMTFFRKCSDGETITVEGRLKNQDDDGIIWNARAVDAEGRTLMYIRNMVFRRFF